jgi:hypothetical protein
MKIQQSYPLVIYAITVFGSLKTVGAKHLHNCHKRIDDLFTFITKKTFPTAYHGMALFPSQVFLYTRAIFYDGKGKEKTTLEIIFVASSVMGAVARALLSPHDPWGRSPRSGCGSSSACHQHQYTPKFPRPMRVEKTNLNLNLNLNKYGRRADNRKVYCTLELP